MFLAIHPRYEAIGKGSTIELAIANWTEQTNRNVDDEMFEELTFIEGEEVEVERVISYKKTIKEK